MFSDWAHILVWSPVTEKNTLNLIKELPITMSQENFKSLNGRPSSWLFTQINVAVEHSLKTEFLDLAFGDQKSFGKNPKITFTLQLKTEINHIYK